MNDKQKGINCTNCCPVHYNTPSKEITAINNMKEFAKIKAFEFDISFKSILNC